MIGPYIRDFWHVRFIENTSESIHLRPRCSLCNGISGLFLQAEFRVRSVDLSVMNMYCRKMATLHQDAVFEW